MADTETTYLEEMLMCPVCQDIFKDPRQLPCGHSMCMSCLENMMDHSSDARFRCPDCRAYFGQIVEVQKSYALANIAEDFRKSRRRREEQTKNVYCGYCPERKFLAIKTCLKCEVSMCKEHIKDHLELPVFTGHPLVTPLGDLQERKCTQHEDEVLRYYCNVSRRYICNMCALESKQHNLATEVSTVLRRHLTEHMDQHFTMLKEQITESTDSIRRLKDDIQRDRVKGNPADSCLNSVTVVLLCLWFIVVYYAYNYSVENQTLIEELDKQQNNVHHLRSTIAELLAENPMKSHTPPEAGDKATVETETEQGEREAMTYGKESALDPDRDDCTNRMLDPETSSLFLRAPQTCEQQRVKAKLDYPNRNHRLDEDPLLLSALGFSPGTHIWEAEPEGHWDIAVSCKSIRCRNGCAFGNNVASWSLTHNGKGKLFTSHDSWNNRMSVMVNFEKGNITLRGVEPTVTQLHGFKAKLTQPGRPGLGLRRVDPPRRASVVKAS